MKTESPTPDHEELKALLANSFHSEDAEDVPPLPDDLRDRIRDQYGAKTAEKAAPTEPFFDKIRSFFMTPAFAGAAAALAILTVAMVMFNQGEGTRKTGPAGKGTTAIYLIGLEAEELKTIRDSELFAKGEASPIEVLTLEEARQKPSPKVIVNGESGRIESFNAEGAPSGDLAFPAAPDQLDDEVAKAVAESLLEGN